MDTTSQGTVALRRSVLVEPDFERTFLAWYPALRRATARGATIVAGGDPHGEPRIVELDTSEPFAIIGRHAHCRLQLEDSPSLALRHLFVRVDRDHVEVRDLRTGQGFCLPGAGYVGAARARGHVMLGVGGAVVFILPRAVLAEWPEDAMEAWRRLPPMRVDEPSVTAAVDGRAVAPVTVEVARIVALPPPRELSIERPPLGEGAGFGVVTLQGGGAEVVVPVSREELTTGLLIGRYPRCQIGAELAAIDSWSRVHVLLLEQEGRVTAFDTASTPGTLVDARPVGFSELGEHAVLELGRDVRLVWQRLV